MASHNPRTLDFGAGGSGLVHTVLRVKGGHDARGFEAVSAESQQCRCGPVKFVAVDLYERLLAERGRDPAAFARKCSAVMAAAVEHYGRARARAVENAGRKARRGR
jgi:hypothetical protein